MHPIFYLLKGDARVWSVVLNLKPDLGSQRAFRFGN